MYFLNVFCFKFNTGVLTDNRDLITDNINLSVCIINNIMRYYVLHSSIYIASWDINEILNTDLIYIYLIYNTIRCQNNNNSDSQNI